MIRKPARSGTSIATGMGLPDIPIHIYEPELRHPRRPGLVMFNDGRREGHAAHLDRERCLAASWSCGAVVVDVDVSDADEFERRSGIDLGYWVWAWVLDNAARLGMHERCIAVGGSAGGIAYSQSAIRVVHELDEIPPILEIAFYPGDVRDGPDLSCASQMSLIERACGAFLCVGTNDRRRSCIVDYAQRLREAGHGAHVYQLHGVGETFADTDDARRVALAADIAMIEVFARVIERRH